MNKLLKNLLEMTGKIFSFWYILFSKIKSARNYFYTGLISYWFNHFGKSCICIYPIQSLVGSKYINIGDNVIFNENIVLTAWDNYYGQQFSPQITIGNGSNIGGYSKITAINKITIGNDVLIGRNVLITDHVHGHSLRELLDIPPSKRNLYSRGHVIIEDNVWLGEKVSVLPGVTIGKGSIIGANAVVTKNIPAYCIACGIPAKIIKTMDI
jgi:acetyltransferase-like isoleucine patch superfamily enzyme